MQTIVCAASGPSLCQNDLEYVRGRAPLYAVNDVYKLAPWAKVFYACDAEWWDAHHEGIENLAGEKWTINKAAAEKYKLNFIPGLPAKKFSNSPGYIATGGNSGFQALNLAVLHGAQRVILLGYDMQLAPDGKRHFFGNHPGGMNRNSRYQDWIKNFRRAKPYIKIEVINCTRETALDCFPKTKLKDAL